jgi:hypothetical protein
LHFGESHVQAHIGAQSFGLHCFFMRSHHSFQPPSQAKCPPLHFADVFLLGGTRFGGFGFGENNGFETSSSAGAGSVSPKSQPVSTTEKKIPKLIKKAVGLIACIAITEGCYDFNTW